MSKPDKEIKRQIGPICLTYRDNEILALNPVAHKWGHGSYPL